MHEKGIAEEIIHQAVALAREKGISRITTIRVGLGKDSHITREALGFWFDLVKANTLAEQAVLKVRKGKGDAVVLTSLEGEAADAHQQGSSRP